MSIDSDILQIDSITNEHLKIINQVLDEDEQAKTSLDQFGKYMLNGTSLVGNLTKILDSVNDGGARAKFITKILEYVNL